MPRAASPARPAPDDADGTAFGVRLRDARMRAGLTQAELAGERYTKAHISALEHGLANPSVEALAYLAGRLGTTSAGLLGGLADGAWTSLEADLALATGAWSEAVDRYRALLDGGVGGTGAGRGAGRPGRGPLPPGPGPGGAAGGAGGRSGVRAGRHGRPGGGGALLAGLCGLPHGRRGRRWTVLLDLLERSRTGSAIGPDLQLRVLIALGATEGREGHAERALAFLEEARGVAADLDDRRRAAFLHGLAASYRELGDLEAAVTAGQRSLALFRASAGAGEVAAMENELALARLALGHMDEAGRYARAAVEQGRVAR